MTFGVSLQFKLGSASAGRAQLLTAGPFKLAWSGVSGLHFAAGGAVAGSRLAWNDATWHTVNAAWNGTHASIAVVGRCRLTLSNPR